MVYGIGWKAARRPCWVEVLLNLGAVVACRLWSSEKSLQPMFGLLGVRINGRQA